MVSIALHGRLIFVPYSIGFVGLTKHFAPHEQLDNWETQTQFFMVCFTTKLKEKSSPHIRNIDVPLEGLAV